MSISSLPALNALLNACTMLLLVLGFDLIRMKKVAAHKFCMLSALALSTLFLISYITYHAFHGVSHFRGQGTIRSIYFFILTTHTVLSIVQLPLIFFTFKYALKGDFERHKKWAKVTFPIWLYVSATGVLVYWLLYRIVY